MSQRDWSRLIAPLAADICGLIFFVTWFGTLRTRFSAREVDEALLFAGIFLLFCFAAMSLRRLPSENSHSETGLQWVDVRQKRWIRVVGAIVVAVFMIGMQADLYRYIESALFLGENPGTVNEGEVGHYFVLGPGFLWISLSLFYLLMMVVDTRERVEWSTTRQTLSTFLSLTAINLMVTFSAAYVGSVFDRVDPLSLGAKVGMFVLLALLFDVMFTTARLLHYFKRPLLLPLLTFATFVTYAVVATLL